MGLFDFFKRKKVKSYVTTFKGNYKLGYDENIEKGKAGEEKVNKALNPLFFGKVEHRQINNLTIVDENGKSHQIDHIEIRRNGIFCIETKNYIGYIFGDENQDQWTQTLYTGQKNKFYNPLKQNKSHCYYLSKIFKRKYKINSLVVLANNNKGKIKSRNVVTLSNLRRYLNVFNEGSNYSTQEMDYIYNKLLSVNENVSMIDHLNHIGEMKYNIRNKICPRCGGELVLRKGKYGQFYGCSNYPKCKFMMKIKNESTDEIKYKRKKH